MLFLNNSNEVLNFILLWCGWWALASRCINTLPDSITLTSNAEPRLSWRQTIFAISRVQLAPQIEPHKPEIYWNWRFFKNKVFFKLTNAPHPTVILRASLFTKANTWSNYRTWTLVTENKFIYIFKLGQRLTYWGLVTHICASKLTTVGPDNGLSPVRYQAIIWPNAWIWLIRPIETNFSEISSEIHAFSFRKMHLKISFVKWRQCCIGLNVLTNYQYGMFPLKWI